MATAGLNITAGVASAEDSNQANIILPVFNHWTITHDCISQCRPASVAVPRPGAIATLQTAGPRRGDGGSGS